MTTRVLKAKRGYKIIKEQIYVDITIDAGTKNERVFPVCMGELLNSPISYTSGGLPKKAADFLGEIKSAYKAIEKKIEGLRADHPELVICVKECYYTDENSKYYEAYYYEKKSAKEITRDEKARLRRKARKEKEKKDQESRDRKELERLKRKYENGGR